jgi:hypothetical protein
VLHFFARLWGALLIPATAPAAVRACSSNRMVNMMLTNEKLFLRAVNIVADVSGAPHPVAHSSVLRAIYGDSGGPPAPDASLDAHVALAAVTPLVIPVAVLLAASDASLSSSPVAAAEAPLLTVADARVALAAEPRVSRVLLRARAHAAVP